MLTNHVKFFQPYICFIIIIIIKKNITYVGSGLVGEVMDEPLGKHEGSRVGLGHWLTSDLT